MDGNAWGTVGGVIGRTGTTGRLRATLGPLLGRTALDWKCAAVSLQPREMRAEARRNETEGRASIARY
jgi:hypothetical protein